MLEDIHSTVRQYYVIDCHLKNLSECTGSQSVQVILTTMTSEKEGINLEKEKHSLKGKLEGTWRTWTFKLKNFFLYLYYLSQTIEWKYNQLFIVQCNPPTVVSFPSGVENFTSYWAAIEVKLKAVLHRKNYSPKKLFAKYAKNTFKKWNYLKWKKKIVEKICS